MTTRVTLRLPDTVYQRILEVSRASGRSLNQVMVDALDKADLVEAATEGMSPQERLNWALRAVAPPLTEEERELMMQVFEGDNDDDPVLTSEELWELLPKLPRSQWLSQAVIDDREDRF